MQENLKFVFKEILNLFPYTLFPENDYLIDQKFKSSI